MKTLYLFGTITFIFYHNNLLAPALSRKHLLEKIDLLELSSQRKELEEAVFSDDITQVQVFFSKHTAYPLNKEVDENGNNVLMKLLSSTTASKEKDQKSIMEIIELLLDKGIDNTNKNVDNDTALDIAERNNLSKTIISIIASKKHRPEKDSPLSQRNFINQNQ